MFPTRATRVLQQAYVVSMQLAFMSTQLAMHQPLPHRGTATASDELPAGSARALPLHASESQEEFGNGLRRIACGLSSCSTTTSGTATASDELPAGSACALPLQASEPQEEFGNGLRRIARGLSSCSTTTSVRAPGGVWSSSDAPWSISSCSSLDSVWNLCIRSSIGTSPLPGGLCVCHPLYQRVVTSSDKLQQYCKNIAGGSGFQ